jgi:CRISPR system Cascade subunit CasD
MASWGDIAVGEIRPSFSHPSKSAVLGLIAAALGIRRDEEAKHQSLSSSFDFGVRIETPGIPIRDYHSVQVPPSGTGRNKRTYATRKDELDVPKEDLATILSSRDYYCDALYTVGLWAVTSNPPCPLSEIAAALSKPTFTLYLGRKSCPMALPLEPRMVEAASLREAFQQCRFSDGTFLKYLELSNSVHVYWEGGEDAGYQAVHLIQRRDLPISRRRWQFTTRTEHYAVEAKSKDKEG